LDKLAKKQAAAEAKGLTDVAQWAQTQSDITLAKILKVNLKLNQNNGQA
jgi:hypothetical protein